MRSIHVLAGTPSISPCGVAREVFRTGDGRARVAIGTWRRALSNLQMCYRTCKVSRTCAEEFQILLDEAWVRRVQNGLTESEQRRVLERKRQDPNRAIFPEAPRSTSGGSMVMGPESGKSVPQLDGDPVLHVLALYIYMSTGTRANRYRYMYRRQTGR